MMELGISKISFIPFLTLAQKDDYEVLPFQTSLDMKSFHFWCDDDNRVFPNKPCSHSN
jgi:hypothetical protein